MGVFFSLAPDPKTGLFGGPISHSYTQTPHVAATSSARAGVESWLDSPRRHWNQGLAREPECTIMRPGAHGYAPALVCAPVLMASRIQKACHARASTDVRVAALAVLQCAAGGCGARRGGKTDHRRRPNPELFGLANPKATRHSRSGGDLLRWVQGRVLARIPRAPLKPRPRTRAKTHGCASKRDQRNRKIRHRVKRNIAELLLRHERWVAQLCTRPGRGAMRMEINATKWTARRALSSTKVTNSGKTSMDASAAVP